MNEGGDRVTLEVLERLTVVTPLAVRFCDHATQAFVSDGLSVETYPVSSPEQRTGGLVNRLGIFVFNGLPGLRVVEHDDGAAGAVSHDFVLEMRDRTGHFLPFTLDVRLPIRRLLSVAPGDRPSSPLAGDSFAECLPLFSSHVRPLPENMAALRAELVDVATGLPAAWAMVDAHVRGERLVTGLADERGRLMLPIPCPRRAGDGRSTRGTALTVDFSVRYRRRDAVVDIPDLADLLSQPMATAWKDTNQTVELRELTLAAGAELTLGSRGSDEATGPLLVTSAGAAL